MTTPDVPNQVSREDMLLLSNIALRLQVVSLQEELMRRDSQKATTDKKSIQEEMAQVASMLNKKYGLSPDKHRVLPDGTIVPLEALANGQGAQSSEARA